MLFMEARARGHLLLRCLEEMENADESEVLVVLIDQSDEDKDPRVP